VARRALTMCNSLFDHHRPRGDHSPVPGLNR
jgi:hypothetical protein